MIGDRNMFRPLDASADARAFRSADAADAAERMLGSPGALLSWHMSKTFDASELPRTPFVVEVTPRFEFVDLVGTLDVGLTWDNATALEAPKVNVRQSSSNARFTVNSIKGNRLEVWTAGLNDFGVARIISVEEGRQADSETKAPTIPDPTKALTPVIVGLVALAIIIGVLSLRR